MMYDFGLNRVENLKGILSEVCVVDMWPLQSLICTTIHTDTHTSILGASFLIFFFFLALTSPVVDNSRTWQVSVCCNGYVVGLKRQLTKPLNPKLPSLS